MTTKAKGGLVEDLKEKLREVGWFVLIALVRWLLDRLTSNPGEEKGGADQSKR